MATNNAVNTGVQTVNGQLMIGVTGGNAVPATLTQGAGVTITNGAGTVTIASSGGQGLTWVDQVTSSVTMAVNTAYINTNATLVTYTLPSSAAVGSVFGVVGKGAAFYTIAQQASQSVKFGSVTTTVGVGGSITATNTGDVIWIVCTTLNTGFTVYGSVGNLTYV